MDENQTLPQQDMPSNSSSRLKTIIVEIGVVLVLLIVVFAALNFFGIFKFSSILPVLNISPANNTAQNTGQNQTNPNSSPSADSGSDVSSASFRRDVLPQDITAASSVPGYEVTFNKDAVMGYLNENEVFGKVYDEEVGNTGPNGVQVINLKLVIDAQPNNIYSNNEGVYSSTSTVFSDQTMGLSIHVSQEILGSDKITASGLFTHQFYSLILRATRRTIDTDSINEIRAELGEVLQNRPELNFTVN